MKHAHSIEQCDFTSCDDYAEFDHDIHCASRRQQSAVDLEGICIIRMKRDGLIVCVRLRNKLGLFRLLNEILSQSAPTVSTVFWCSIVIQETDRPALFLAEVNGIFLRPELDMGSCVSPGQHRGSTGRATFAYLERSPLKRSSPSRSSQTCWNPAGCPSQGASGGSLLWRFVWKAEKMRRG